MIDAHCDDGSHSPAFCFMSSNIHEQKINMEGKIMKEKENQLLQNSKKTNLPKTFENQEFISFPPQTLHKSTNYVSISSSDPSLNLKFSKDLSAFISRGRLSKKRMESNFLGIISLICITIHQNWSKNERLNWAYVSNAFSALALKSANSQKWKQLCRERIVEKVKAICATWECVNSKYSKQNRYGGIY